MEDPVTLESGVTYDRQSIEVLFQFQKATEQPCTCPTTKVEVDPEIMIPNINLRKEIERFNEENPWAFEFDPRQHYKDIEIGSIDISAN